MGFIQLMMNLPLERLSIGVAAAAAAEAATNWTIAYTKDREAFGERVADFQNTRFRLADMVTTVDVMWAYIDRAMKAYQEGKLTAEDAAMVKFWATEREWEVLDTGVQLHGGYGYIMEYPIARAFTDARVHRIYGGTNEIMRDLVGRKIVGKR
jgi:acyl-CoA dehydrogenase